MPRKYLPNSIIIVSGVLGKIFHHSILFPFIRLSSN